MNSLPADADIAPEWDAFITSRSGPHIGLKEGARDVRNDRWASALSADGCVLCASPIIRMARRARPRRGADENQTRELLCEAMTRYQRISEHGNVAGLFTARHTTYERFIRVVRYQQGIRAFFLESPILRSGLRVLDAGCGTGVITEALREALIRRQMDVGRIHAFDLTPAMLRRFRVALDSRGIDGVEMLQANVLQMEDLPATWTDYDLIVSASMLEYVAPDQLPNAAADCSLPGSLGVRDRSPPMKCHCRTGIAGFTCPSQQGCRRSSISRIRRGARVRLASPVSASRAPHGRWFAQPVNCST